MIFAHFLAVVRLKNRKKLRLFYRIHNRDTLITNKSGNTITWLIKETQLDRFEAALEQYSKSQKSMRGDDSQFFSHLSFLSFHTRYRPIRDQLGLPEGNGTIEPGNREEFFILFPKPSRGKSTELVYQNELNGKFRYDRSECSKWITSGVYTLA